MSVAYSIYFFILRDQRKLQEAIYYQQKAIRIRESINKEDPKLAINYNNLGMSYLDCSSLQEAKMWRRE